MLNYIYWDPSREIFPFHLPILDRPLLWYGFFFAFGFFLGYWILVYMLRRYFLYHPFFTAYDIVKANTFREWVHKYKNQEDSAGKIASAFLQGSSGDKIRKEENDFESRKAISSILNRLLQKKELFQDLPSLSKKLRSFLASLPEQTKAILQRRWLLEELFSTSFVSLKQRSRALAEKVTIYVVLGTVIGARLGDVIFYQDWQSIRQDPLSIFKLWEGGLASHGGAIGILIALFLVSKRIHSQYPYLGFLRLLDLVVVPTALVASMIRIGNFFNQEILGTKTHLPWAVVFGHPADGSVPSPRHPVQIYESLFYFIVFIGLIYVWKRNVDLPKPGKIFGLFLLLVFGFRFFIEFLKTEQSAWLASSYLTMGQYLSIPFFLLGIFLFFKRR
jgi:phosphatidylglycerol---prolipoprotein diacylglyceryl transferase